MGLKLWRNFFTSSCAAVHKSIEIIRALSRRYKHSGLHAEAKFRQKQLANGLDPSPTLWDIVAQVQPSTAELIAVEILLDHYFNCEESDDGR